MEAVLLGSLFLFAVPIFGPSKTISFVVHSPQKRLYNQTMQLYTKPLRLYILPV